MNIKIFKSWEHRVIAVRVHPRVTRRFVPWGATSAPFFSWTVAGCGIPLSTSSTHRSWHRMQLSAEIVYSIGFRSAWMKPIMKNRMNLQKTIAFLKKKMVLNDFDDFDFHRYVSWTSLHREEACFMSSYNDSSDDCLKLELSRFYHKPCTFDEMIRCLLYLWSFVWSSKVRKLRSSMQ